MKALSTKGVTVPQLRSNGVNTVADSFSSAHILHNSCTETGADTGTVDAVGGSTFSTIDFFPDQLSNAVTFQANSNTGFITNGFRRVTQGVCIYYFCANFHNDARITTDSSNKNKCGLNHLTPFSYSGPELQRNLSENFTTFEVSIPEEVINGASFKGCSGQIVVSGSDSVEVWNGGSQAGLLRFEIGKGVESIKYIRMDGKVFTVTNDQSNPSGALIDQFDLTDGGMWDAINGASGPSGGWSQSMKSIDLFIDGFYNFTAFNPSDKECAAMASWLYHNSRNGNKQAYPLWASKT